MPRFQIPYPTLDTLMSDCTADQDKCNCATHWCARNCSGDNEISLFMGHIQQEFRKLDTARESVKPRMFWITINPPKEADEDPVSFLNRITDLLSRRKWIKQCYYSIEQRSSVEGERYTGVHSHLLVVSECPVKTVKRPAQAHREIYSWFLSKYPSINKPAIDLKTFPMSYYDDKLDYIKGLKDDPDKDSKIAQDVLFRSKFGFLPYYHYSKEEE